MREEYPENQDLMKAYFKPLTRWTDVLQNDFAARADWCVKSYDEANHPPIDKLNHNLDLNVKPDAMIQLSAQGTYYPDNYGLIYNWLYYKEASDYKGEIEIENNNTRDATLIIPKDINTEMRIYVICEVTDKGIPPLTRYKCVIINIVP
jgi:Cellulose-binding protein Sde0182, C-terminal domain